MNYVRFKIWSTYNPTADEGSRIITGMMVLDGFESTSLK